MHHLNDDDQDADYEVLVSQLADTIWINGPDGSCVGRFGRMGIDLHTTAAEQLDGASQCRLCTHSKPTQEDWALFREKAGEWWGIEIPTDMLDPKRFGWTVDSV